MRCRSLCTPCLKRTLRKNLLGQAVARCTSSASTLRSISRSATRLSATRTCLLSERSSGVGWISEFKSFSIYVPDHVCIIRHALALKQRTWASSGQVHFIFKYAAINFEVCNQAVRNADMSAFRKVQWGGMDL